MRDSRTKSRSPIRKHTTSHRNPSSGANRREGPRLRDVLNDCNKRALNYAKYVDITADNWLDHHEQEVLGTGQRWIRRLLAILLLPIGLIAMGALVSTLSQHGVKTHVLLSVPVWYTIMGALICLIIAFSGLCRNMFLYVYVLGHELTHYIAIYCSGGKVDDFQVSLDGGHVITNKNNMFIALSPYFIPIWVLAWFILAGLTAIFQPWETFSPVAFAGLGFWWAFHFYWTVWIIPKDQPDLNENGTFFSLMIVYLINLAFITLSFILTGALDARAFIREFVVQAGLMGEFIHKAYLWLNTL